MSEKIRWIKIAASLEEISFADINIAEVYADDKKICVAKHRDEVFAFAHKCPMRAVILLMDTLTL